MRLHAMKFGLASGLWLGACTALATASALVGVPGFAPFADLLAQFYGPWGYSVTWPGVAVGFGYGFLEGFVHLGALAWLYNRLIDRSAA